MGLLGLVLWGFFGLLGGYIAVRKGIPPIVGVGIGLALGPLWLIAMSLLPADRVFLDARDGMESKERKACEDCGREVALSTPVCPACNKRF